jgi:hypothetical protein
MFYWLTHWREKRMHKRIYVLQHERESNQVSQQAIDQEIKLLKDLADFYQKRHNSKWYPYATEMLENVKRKAASIGSTEAQLWLGQHLLEHAKAMEIWQNEKVLANQENEKRCRELYFQAHAFLQEASQNSVDALRILGLSSIHGWGVPMDRKKGFGLIVESINRENSWDKVTEIFAKICLNKPEFLQELIKYRTQAND